MKNKLIKFITLSLTVLFVITLLMSCTNSSSQTIAKTTAAAVTPTKSYTQINYNAEPYKIKDVNVAAVVKPYVAPDNAVNFYIDSTKGSDSFDGSIAKPFKTLEKARDTIRPLLKNMKSDIVVNLRGGTYYLNSTFELTDSDSGCNGYNVVYRSYDNERAVISGGTVIDGWTLSDKANNIWKASAKGVDSRSFFVNGQRAVRARTSQQFKKLSFHPESAIKEGQVKSLLNDPQPAADGFTSKDLDYTKLKRQSNIEMVCIASFNQMRMPLESITEENGRAHFTVSKKAWKLFNSTKAVAYGEKTELINTLYYFENAYEFLDKEGEWYLDTDTDTVYYKPLKNENISSSYAVLGKLEQLVTANLSSSNIRFDSISFTHTTWLQANQPEGLQGIQAGYYRSKNATTSTQWAEQNWLRQSAAIIFNYAHNVSIVNCAFMNLGNAALDFGSGTMNAVIAGNYFTDCSGAGIILGGFKSADHFPSKKTPDKISSDNKIIDNLIIGVAAEYADECGIVRGYTFNTQIAYNTIANMPYSGISAGWGWGGEERTAKIKSAFPDGVFTNNSIVNNRIDNVMTLLQDGGAIYCLSRQDNNRIMGNYISNSKEIAIYLDNGSAGAVVKDNVLINNWRSLNLNGGYDITFTNNFTNRTISHRNLIVIDEKSTISYEPWKSNDALRDSIIVNAGVRAPYNQIYGLK